MYNTCTTKNLKVAMDLTQYRSDNGAVTVDIILKVGRSHIKAGNFRKNKVTRGPERMSSGADNVSACYIHIVNESGHCDVITGHSVERNWDSL